MTVNVKVMSLKCFILMANYFLDTNGGHGHAFLYILLLIRQLHDHIYDIHVISLASLFDDWLGK